ncbi:hypothetical protein BS78_08G050100 [Paspalum vaginatum]|nr:hypothetical protein BS78_08G050100 [Paspalum vaginatum]
MPRRALAVWRSQLSFIPLILCLLTFFVSLQQESCHRKIQLDPVSSAGSDPAGLFPPMFFLFHSIFLIRPLDWMVPSPPSCGPCPVSDS